MNDDDAILGEGEVCVTFPAVFIIGFVGVLLGDKTRVKSAAMLLVLIDVDIYPEVVVRRNVDSVEVLACPAVPQTDLVLDNKSVSVLGFTNKRLQAPSQAKCYHPPTTTFLRCFSTPT